MARTIPTVIKGLNYCRNSTETIVAEVNRIISSLDNITTTKYAVSGSDPEEHHQSSWMRQQDARRSHHATWLHEQCEGLLRAQHVHARTIVI